MKEDRGTVDAGIGHIYYIWGGGEIPKEDMAKENIFTPECPGDHYIY